VELFYSKVLDQLRATAGVQSAAVSTALPFIGEYNGAKLQTPEMAAEERRTEVVAVNEVSPGFLETMGVRIINGRSIRETDSANAPKVTVIDQGTAARLWPHQDPLGKLVKTEDPARPVWRQVVGVVASTRDRSLDIAPRLSMYLPLAQGTSGISFLVVRSLTPPADTIRLLKSVVAGVDPDQSVFFSQTVTQLIQDSIATRRFLFLVMMFFAAAALLLSALGIYALVSFLAARRVREVGIRMALGATRGRIAWLVLLQGIRLALIGTAAGWVASVLLSRFMSSLLFGVSPSDLGTLLSAVLGLAGVTTLAALLPAYRCARLEPTQALRTE
jgi:putative ABC transport system permease protein